MTIFLVSHVLSLLPILSYPLQPYAQLMRSLEDRGFIKHNERPTIRKALYYYLVEKPPKLWAEYQERGFDMCIPKCCKESTPQEAAAATCPATTSTNNNDSQPVTPGRDRDDRDRSSSHHSSGHTALI